MTHGCSSRTVVAPLSHGPVYCIGSETWELRVFVAFDNKQLQEQIQVIIKRCFEQRFNIVFLYTEDPQWKSKCDVVICEHPTNTTCTVSVVSTETSRFINITYPQHVPVKIVDILHTIGHVLGLPSLPSDFWLQYPEEKKSAKPELPHHDIFEDSVMRYHSGNNQSCWRLVPILYDLCTFDIQKLDSMYGPNNPTGASIEGLEEVFYVFNKTEN